MKLHAAFGGTRKHAALDLEAPIRTFVLAPPPFSRFEITEVDLRPLDEATIRMLMLQAQIFGNP